MHEKSITFIVPVHGNSGIYLARCLHSLLENQNYDYKDVIVVFDGDKNQMQSALMQEQNYKDDKRVKFYHIEKGGAPKARNFGLEKATGDYVCFFDCDSMLLAGAIQTWVNTFEDNPDVGFVYGGYKFMMKEQYQNGIPAKEFDVYSLTCNNYISSMNPIKREICPKWDETLEGLQDWDLFLTMALNGIKGKKIKEYLVLTEPPSNESISGKTHKNHLEIYNKVREKHGIIDRIGAVTSMGAPFQSLRRAKFLNWDYRDPQMLFSKPHDYKAVISMGYYVESTLHPYYVFVNDTNKKFKKIIYFIGTDVLQLQCKKFIEVREFTRTTCKNVDHIFCNAPWLQTELKEMGIEAELLYCPIDASNYEIGELPKKFTLAVYRSDSNPMHNEAFMFDVAKSCPDINFKFFGGSKLEIQDKPKNIEYMGEIEDEKMPEFINSTSGIARITIHDGFPATLVEWALCGRQFLCNLPDMPKANFIAVTPTDATYIKDKEDMIKAIRNLQRKIKKTTYQEQVELRDYFKELMKPETFIKRINEIANATTVN
jgi:glycosyltransferase involved in cell wall biosynthesis